MKGREGLSLRWARDDSRDDRAGSSQANPPGFFQAFVAVAPAHPLIEAALERHVRWYASLANNDVKEIFRVTRGLEKPNVGTVLLRDAFLSLAGRGALREARARGLVQHHTNGPLGGHVSQLFFEAPGSHLSSRRYKLPAGHKRVDMCSFLVADVRSHTVLFLSRIAAHTRHYKATCSWGGGRLVLNRTGYAPVRETRRWRAWSDPDRDIRHLHKELANAIEFERVLFRGVLGVLCLSGLWGLRAQSGRGGGSTQRKRGSRSRGSACAT